MTFSNDESQDKQRILAAAQRARMVLESSGQRALFLQMHCAERSLGSQTPWRT